MDLRPLASATLRGSVRRMSMPKKSYAIIPEQAAEAWCRLMLWLRDEIKLSR